MAATRERRRRAGGLAATWLGLISCACIGASSPTPVYYALSGTGEATARGPTTYTLAVTRFVTRAAYDRSEVVYREHTRELRYYPFHLWASKPGRMLPEAVTAHLREAGLFADVRYGPVVGASDYELRGEVISIEERDADELSWQAHLAMRFELVTAATQEVVLRYAFDRERPIREREVGAVAEALDGILGEELDILSAKIAEILPASR
jgi:ABC-type uncharacterized transport system auxiliary subunit